MKKILSIIVPTYNMEAYLDKCLSSLIVGDAESELMEMLEVLVVNDGSTDRSSEIAHSYEERFPNTFRVIDKENGNYGSCINAALPQTNGTYVKVLDADDSVDTENITEFLQLLGDCDADVVLHYANSVRVNGMVSGNYGVSPNFFEYFEKGRTCFTFRELVERDGFHPMMHNTTYRTQILKDMNYRQLEGVSYTDNQWMFVPMTKCCSVVLYPKAIYKYLIGREGQTVSKDVLHSHFDDELMMRSQLLREYLAYDGDGAGRRYLKNKFHDSVKYAYLCNIFEEYSYYEKDIRRYDRMLRDMGYPHYEEMDNWKVRSNAYRHSVTVGFWRKWDGRWFYLLEGTLKFFWDPYKKLKKLIRENSVRYLDMSI